MGDIVPILIFIFDGIIFLADDVLHFDIVDEEIKERAIRSSFFLSSFSAGHSLADKKQYRRDYI